MSVGIRLFVAALVALPLGSVPAPAGAGVPASLGLVLERAGLQLDSPFVGDEFDAASEPVHGWLGSTCEVDFGDGTTGGRFRGHSYDPYARCLASHSYASAGTYTIVMTVTDTEGASVSEEREVVVTERPVVAIAAGVEGRAVALAGPSDGSKAVWSYAKQGDNDRCDPLRPRPRAARTLTCYANGSFRINYDTGDAATSGGYVVTWTNGVPRPEMRSTRTLVRRDGNPYYVPVRRIGTGDSVRFDVVARDPSTQGVRPGKGDRIRCVYNHGNGLSEQQEAYSVKGTCNGETAYLAPGRHTSRVRVTDQDGASARAQATVVVVRRDVHLRIRDVKKGGTRGVIRASLTPRGLQGRVDVTFPNGHHVVSTRLTSIQVTRFGSVRLLGRAMVDGRTGYRFVVFPETTYPQDIAFQMFVQPVGEPENDVVAQIVEKDEFRVSLHAPPVN